MKELGVLSMNRLQKTIEKYGLTIAIIIWLGLGIRAAIIELVLHVNSINNYLIYKHVYFHLINQQNLYVFYPNQYEDCNHYGPLFGLIIAPFALMPDFWGCLFWCLFSMFFLYKTISLLQLPTKYKVAILLISAIELQTAVHQTQFNIILTGLILLSFILIQKDKLFLAALIIAIGTLTKLYGIIGIFFILFSDNKIKFIFYILCCFILLFFIPSFLSSLDFIIHTYVNWAESLFKKNSLNINLLDTDYWQDISIMGVFRRTFNISNLENLYFQIPAALFYLLALLRKSQFQYFSYRLAILSSLLIGLVVFNSSSEIATYIIASIGVGLWYVLQEDKKSYPVILLITLSFLVSNFVTYYILPDEFSKNYYCQYSIKSIPYFIIWVSLSFQILSKDFKSINLSIQSN